MKKCRCGRVDDARKAQRVKGQRVGPSRASGRSGQGGTQAQAHNDGQNHAQDHRPNITRLVVQVKETLYALGDAE